MDLLKDIICTLVLVESINVNMKHLYSLESGICTYEVCIISYYKVLILN